MSKLMTPKEIAALLQVSEETLGYWRQKGTGPAYSKLGQLIRYDEADVKKWLKERKVGA